MKIVFVSNFFNHHQEFLSRALYEKTNGEYWFIANEQVPEERLNLGYEDANKKYEYIIRAYENEEENEKAKKLIADADVVITEPTYTGKLSDRLKQNKITFLYSERIYRKNVGWWKYPKWLYEHGKRFRRHKNLYLLSTGAFVLNDYAKTFCFINKAYKWGYFTEVKKYDVNEIIQKKRRNTVLWVARMIDLKHPEEPIYALKKLKEQGYKFHLNMIGTGDKEEEIKQLLKNCDMEDCVTMLGSMSPQEVRKYMEKSEIFLFTSDRQEGWGAVLNEAMNSMCAVVASHAIGAVPYLLEEGVNGSIYKSGNVDQLATKIKELLDNDKKRKEIAVNAYETMINEWNAGNAADKLINVAEIILRGGENQFPYEKGVCSKAEVTPQKMYRKVIKNG